VTEPVEDVGRREFLHLLARRSGVALGAFALGMLADSLWGRLVRGGGLTQRGAVDLEADPPFVVGHWRIHHNVVGYALVFVGVFAYPVVLVPLGLGMIVGHGVRDRLFWFAERVE